MLMRNIKKGQRVFDRWWSEKIWTVVRVCKKSVHLRYDDETVIYDADHVQFLEPVPERGRYGTPTRAV